jgi:serine O-acetyltransferase
MRLAEFIYLVKSDLWRYAGNARLRAFLFELLLTPGFSYTFWMRLCAFLRQHRILKFGFYHVAKLILRHQKYKYGIAIHEQTRIGPGLFIGHFGGIVVHAETVIGKNCNLSHDVTLAMTNRGPRRGYPTLGDHVYVGPGARILGKVTVGDHVAIGANCVVTKDVPDNAVVVGIPGRVISFAGSEGYINRTDYGRLRRQPAADGESH